eukprot:Rmarinus@m.29572
MGTASFLGDRESGVEYTLVAFNVLEVCAAAAVLVAALGGAVLTVQNQGHPFTKISSIRYALLLISVIWTLACLLEASYIWHEDGWLSQDFDVYKQLCRLHTVTAYGLAEPMFYITILSILRRQYRSNPENHDETPSIAWVFLWASPIFLCQIVIVGVEMLSSSWSMADELKDKDEYVFLPYDETYQSCVVPYASVVVSILFVLVFCVAFRIFASSVESKLLNRALRKRLSRLYVPLVGLLVVVVLRIGAAMLMSEKNVDDVGDDRTRLWVLLRANCAVSLLSCLYGLWLVVLRPALDIVAIRKDEQLRVVAPITDFDTI